MANLNKVFLIGNLTRDPDVRYTPKGTAVADLGLAINRTWTDDEGQKKEETTFVDVTLWGRTAEIAQQYLKKGNPAFVEGHLQLDTWDDKQTGQKRFQTQDYRRAPSTARQPTPDRSANCLFPYWAHQAGARSSPIIPSPGHAA
jgi:single stranded DNA-binding protein